eukprot:GFUD01018576.1.p1 GENE.GFUD01018576.1~~GFUD01018576.1.p1  ORF type:complete len:401 (-),score=128.47 GFUD01018576.1:46-1248(-)
MSKEIERYPDPNLFDQVLYDNILQLPDNGVIDIKFVQQHIWDQGVSFNIPKEKVIRGMQANMFSIQVKNKEGESRNVVVKRIVPMELPEKPSQEVWRGFIVSVRTEMEFYQQLNKPEHENIRKLFPSVYFSAGSPSEMDNSPKETSFSMIMQDLNEDYIQKPMMNESEAQCVLDSLAKLHAHYWNKVDGANRGSFWVLELRKAFPEVENADQTWNEFVDRFPELESVHTEVRKIGAKLGEKAEELDRFVSVGANTRIHGDAKGWNFFFARKNSPAQEAQPFLFIDMQWTGRGHPLQDVAYALTTTLDQETLPKMDKLVDHYVNKLGSRLEEKGEQLDREKLRQQYDQVWLDYARVIVSGLWKRLNSESMLKNKEKVGPSMINRSWPHVMFITSRLCKLLL